MPICYLYVILEKYLFNVFTFFDWVVYLYELYLPVASFTNTFTIIWVVFLLMFLFVVQKLSSLKAFGFIYFALVNWYTKICLWFILSVLWMYFSRSFIVSSVKFVFKPFWVCFYICYERIFLSHYFTCSCPVFLALLEEIIFSSLYILASFVID